MGWRLWVPGRAGCSHRSKEPGPPAPQDITSGCERPCRTCPAFLRFCHLAASPGGTRAGCQGSWEGTQGGRAGAAESSCPACLPHASPPPAPSKLLFLQGGHQSFHHLPECLQQGPPVRASTPRGSPDVPKDIS